MNLHDKTLLHCFALISMLLPAPLLAEVTKLDSEQMHFRRITTKEGLPSMYVNTITQRSNGIIWIGTKGGLARFDGQNMSTYHYSVKNNTSLGSDDVTALFEDDSNRLWVGTSRGIYLFNDDTNNFLPISLTQDHSEPVIFYISQDANHNYWLGTNQGIFVINQALDVIWQGLESHVVKYIGQVSNNKTWIGTKQGLLIINPTNFTLKPLLVNKKTENDALSFEQLTIYDGLIDDTTLWLATNNYGVVKIDNQSNKIITHYSAKDNTLISKSIWSLAKRGDDLWLGYFYDGIGRINTKSLATSSSRYHPQIDYTIPYNNVSKVYFDNSGLLWVATTNGLAVTDVKNSMIKQIGEFQNITNKHVWSIDRQGDDIWFGSEDGLNKVNLTTNELTTYPSSRAKDALPRTIIWALSAEPEKIWLGTNQGLIKFLPTTSQAIVYKNPLFEQHQISNQSVYSFTRQNNELIIGYYNGAIAKFNTKTETFYDTQLDVSKGYITNIMAINNNEHIVASQYGLVNVNNRDVTSILPDVIGDHHITAMRMLNEQLWIATLSNGIFVLTRVHNQWSMLKHLSIDNNLPENSIKSLSIDGQGRLWAAGRKAIFSIDPNRYTITLFTSQFHWLGMEFHDNAANNYQDDIVAFAGNEGLVLFSAKTINKQITFPKLTLSSIQITNKKFNRVNNNHGVTIEPNENFYSFSVSALEFLAPEAIIYEYRLTPSQETWQRLDNSIITLSNLPYERYQLHLRATNSDQVFNKDELKININVVPPFWWSPMAKIFYVLLIILLVARTIISQKNHLKRMTFKARHDALTGLPNRDFLLYELELKIEKAQKHHHKIAVLFFDLNGFKSINDNYGHDVGDKLLKHVALAVSNCIREKDFFARQSGDEFILVLDDINHHLDIPHMVERIRAAFSQDFIHDDQKIPYGSSIGISVFNSNELVSGETLIKQADKAMYQSKKTKAPFCYFDETL